MVLVCAALRSGIFGFLSSVTLVPCLGVLAVLGTRIYSFSFSLPLARTCFLWLTQSRRRRRSSSCAERPASCLRTPGTREGRTERLMSQSPNKA